MLIDGTDAKDYGLVLLRKEGFFDMPPRRPPYFHDWGDEVEPLFDAIYLAHAPQVFEADFLFDDRLTANTIEDTIAVLEGLGEFVVDLDHLLVFTDHDHFTVKVDRVVTLKRYRSSAAKLRVFFYHRVPVFKFWAYTRTNVSDYRYGVPGDEYDLSVYSISVRSVSNIYSLGQLKNSPVIAYNSGPRRTAYRDLKQIDVDCVLRGTDHQDSIFKLMAFKRIIQLPGTIKEFHYKGTVYDTFCTSGFEVKSLEGDRTFLFKMTLNVL